MYNSTPGDCYQNDSFGQIWDFTIEKATFLTVFNQTVLQLTYTILTFLPHISLIYYSLGCLGQNFYYCHHIIAQWDPLLNRTGQIGQTFVRDMSLLESQSKGCVNLTFDPAHTCIFAMYLQGCICTVGTRARANPIFWDLCSSAPPFKTPLLTVCPPNIWFLAKALICSSKGMNFIRDDRIGG